ncbi:1,2-phenylacetyl-CoA epoxidase subunit PaaC [Anaerobacillus sp. MEB173]|uniref:1,2-phenylacetyl-CoA epoxidase subunit PaaC n=1 Tax=Anaerobacillus sp. MEB173 TaxID=3383345 RepID=UPI003F8FCC84
MIYNTANDVNANASHKEALIELLYQLADDDFLTSYRGSEWLGLAPHIEEDVAFSSITQDKMGHATLFYQLLEELGEGHADQLAHARQPEKFRNAVLLEEVNGSGNYLNEPKYDWAFAVVRNYFYDVAKKVRLDSLKKSSYLPLSHAAIKISGEQYYHGMHWSTWFKQLTNCGGEARERMVEAVQKVWDDFAGVLTLGPAGKVMEEAGFIEGEDVLIQRTKAKLAEVFNEVNIVINVEPAMKKGNGRAGVHTNDLSEALATLSEVYAKDPVANW